MINKKKQEMHDDFVWWVTCIPDKIDFLKTLLPTELSIKLDGSLDSLDIIGNYLIENYSQETIKSEFELWDSIAAYIGDVFKKYFANSRWFIELDDKKYISYNQPMLIHLETSKSLDFVPHKQVLSALTPPGFPNSWTTEIKRQKEFLPFFIEKYGDRTTSTLQLKTLL